MTEHGVDDDSTTRQAGDATSELSEEQLGGVTGGVLSGPGQSPPMDGIM